MAHDEAFIQSIRAAPTDDAPRLIYADWLEEHGQAERAEFIRVQCRLAGLPEDAPIKPELHSRAEELLRKNWNEWVGPLRTIVGPWRDRYREGWMQEEYHPDGLLKFQRGFVDSLSLDAEDFLKHVRQLQRLAPLRVLRLWRGGRWPAELAQEPALSGLVVLGFMDYYNFPLRPRDMAALATSPYLHGLSTLLLGRNYLGDEGVEALAQAPWLAEVKILDLTDNGLSDRAARALADSRYVDKLTILYLRRNALSRAGVAALRDSPNLRNTLHLEYDPPETAVAEERAQP